MTDQEISRKLAVIVHADVAGSTALVQRDETLAHTRINAAFQRFSSIIQEYNGTVHEIRGDALVAGFARASDAVCAALSFQQSNTEHNAQFGDDMVPVVRVGIALGEEVFADDTVTGAGVVLAQRVEQLSEPGGVCVTGAIHEAIPQRMPFAQESLGEQEVKGFDEPVRVYRVVLKPGAAVPEAETRRETQSPSQTRRLIVAFAAVALIVTGGVVFWLKPWAPEFEPASVERMAFPLPDKPSIAVLPFDNLSGDPEQDYFSDGLTEDIITHLTRFPDLFVIARNSTFTYKGQSVTVKQVAEELGVHYVLEGSVQKAGEKVRITAQLIDATTGHHLWAENFDRTLDDVFAVRDEVMQSIVSTLMGSDYAKLRQAELVRLSRKDPANLGAYELVQRAIKIWLRFTKEANEEARGLIKKALELDPGYARAYSMLAWVNLNEYQYKFSDDPERSLERAFELAQKSIALDDADDWSHWALGVVYLHQRKFDESIAEYERALARNPNDADVLAHMGLALTFAGQPERAIRQLTRAKRLNPNYPPWYPSILGLAYVVAKQYEPAIIALREQVNRMPDWPTPHRTLAVAYAQLGRQDDARREVEILLKLDPQASIENVKFGLPFKDEANLEHFLGGLRKAGLPETPPLTLPDKPSIAVLPFTNMSDDPEQEYFADGITEDIITELSRFKDLFVISRTSSFAYKGKNVTAQEIGRELGVRYLLEGSVRRSGKQLRVTAQLIEAQTGSHIWAERYDRQVDDVFAIQDEINGAIVTTLGETLWQAAAREVARKPTSSFEAYDYYLRAIDDLHRLTRDDNLKARDLFEKARERDPEFAGVYVGLAWTYLLDFLTQWVKAGEETLDRALDYTNTAAELGSDNAQVHRLLGRISQARGRYDEALAQFERALELNPNDGDILAQYGNALVYAGRSEEGIQWAEEAVRRNPHHPDWYATIVALGHYLNGRYRDALPYLNRIEGPKMWDHRLLAATYAQLGNLAKAKEHVAAMLAVNPETTISTVRPIVAFKNRADVDRYLEGLRKAGLPE